MLSLLTPRGESVLKSDKSIESEIHTSTVRASIAAAGINLVLGYKAPEIHSSEESLPCIFCITLAQLRSGKCCNLKSYQHFINAADNDVCPDCRSAPYSTNHLFNCHAFQTSLTVINLWQKPMKAAEFLLQIPSFNHLPPLCPVLPPPHPSHRPLPASLPGSDFQTRAKV
jgi:hypothetical protein